VEEALVVLLQLLLFRQLCFPLFGKLPSNQSVLRLNEAVVSGGTLRFISGTLQALLPQAIKVLAFLFEMTCCG
jgi:hypothetical protein